MWIDILIAVLMLAWAGGAAYALRKWKRRRGCAGDCTRCQGCAMKKGVQAMKNKDTE